MVVFIQNGPKILQKRKLQNIISFDIGPTSSWNLFLSVLHQGVDISSKPNRNRSFKLDFRKIRNQNWELSELLTILGPWMKPWVADSRTKFVVYICIYIYINCNLSAEIQWPDSISSKFARSDNICTIINQIYLFE